MPARAMLLMCQLACLSLAVIGCACSRTTPPVTHQGASVQPANAVRAAPSVRAVQARPDMQPLGRTPGGPCPRVDDDTQPVRFDIDDTFIANHDVSDVLDPVWWTGYIYGSVAEYESCLTPFSRPQRLMYALLWYQAEVNNGGHDQFFFNSTGIAFPDALSGMEELRLSEGVAILAEAGRRMGGQPARERAERVAQLDRRKPEFDDLDTRFYAFELQLRDAMQVYMRAHSAAFHFTGVVDVPQSVVESRKRIRAHLGM